MSPALQLSQFQPQAWLPFTWAIDPTFFGGEAPVPVFLFSALPEFVNVPSPGVILPGASPPWAMAEVVPR